MFTIAQQILFPVCAILQSFVTLFILYKFGKRPLLGQYTFNDRMEPLYSFAAAALLGQFLFHALPNATNPLGPQTGAFIRIFVMFGFFVMLCVQKYQRFNHYNPYYTSSDTTSVEIVSLLDRESMELAEFFHAEDLESEDVANDRLQLADESAELTKRRKVNALTVFTLIFLCFLEGFFLVYRESGWLTWSFFMLGKWLESVTIGVSLLHALLHCNSETESRWFLIIAIVWSIVCAMSTLPVLLQMDYDTAYQIINHIATRVFYATAGGVLFWIALYYVWIDRKNAEKKDTIVRLVIFGIVCGLSWVSGYFF